MVEDEIAEFENEPVPADLEQQVRALLKEHPEVPWDSAVAALAGWTNDDSESYRGAQIKFLKGSYSASGANTRAGALHTKLKPPRGSGLFPAEVGGPRGRWGWPAIISREL